MNHGKDGSWSDSESGFLHPPIKSKLKGLLGKKVIYDFMVSVSSVVEFPGTGLSRLRTINSELNGAT